MGHYFHDMKNLRVLPIATLTLLTLLNSSCVRNTHANEPVDDVAAACKKPKVCVTPAQVCTGTSKCAPADQICAGTSKCVPGCVWKDVGGPHISVGRGPATCWAQNKGENDSHLVIVDVAGDDDASCYSGHSKVSVGAVALRSRGVPTLMVKVPAGKVLCSDNPGIGMNGSCTPGCLPE